MYPTRVRRVAKAQSHAPRQATVAASRGAAKTLLARQPALIVTLRVYAATASSLRPWSLSSTPSEYQASLSWGSRSSARLSLSMAACDT